MALDICLCAVAASPLDRHSNLNPSRLQAPPIPTLLRWRHDSLWGVRIGEAPRPGPVASFDDPEADFNGPFSDEDCGIDDPDDWMHSDEQEDVWQPAVSNYSVGDLGFQDHQLESWRIAEAEAGLKACDAKQSAVAKASSAAKKAKEQAAKPQWPNSIEGLDFFPARGVRRQVTRMDVQDQRPRSWLPPRKPSR